MYLSPSAIEEKLGLEPHFAWFFKCYQRNILESRREADYQRNTGRTTNMLIKAISAATKGKSSTIISNDLDTAHLYTNMTADMLNKIPEIKVRKRHATCISIIYSSIDKDTECDINFRVCGREEYFYDPSLNDRVRI